MHTRRAVISNTLILYRALILYRRRRFINHLLTHLLTYIIANKALLDNHQFLWQSKLIFIFFISS